MAVSFPFIVIHVSSPSMWLIAVLFANHLRDYLWLAPIWMIAVNMASISVVTETLLFFWVVTDLCINVPLAFTFYHLCEWWLIPLVFFIKKHFSWYPSYWWIYPLHTSQWFLFPCRPSEWWLLRLPIYLMNDSYHWTIWVMAVSFPFIVFHVSLPSMWLIAVLFVNHLRDYLWLAPIWMIAVNMASISVVTETLLFFWVVTDLCINVPMVPFIICVSRELFLSILH